MVPDNSINCSMMLQYTALLCVLLFIVSQLICLLGQFFTLNIALTVLMTVSVLCI